MCGRFTLNADIESLQEQFQFEYAGENPIIPRYNIAPSQDVLAVGFNGEVKKGSMLHWGLIPSWAKDPKIGYKMINARAESIDHKPSFKQAFLKRRCLILASGFYEWKKLEGKTKQPYYFAMTSGKPFAFAGIWESWRGGNKPIHSCTIITTTPNAVTEDIHDRMPVILNEDDYDTWLSSRNEDINLLKSMLIPYPAEEMEKYPISSLVNSPKNDTKEILVPLNSF